MALLLNSILLLSYLMHRTTLFLVGFSCGMYYNVFVKVILVPLHGD